MKINLREKQRLTTKAEIFRALGETTGLGIIQLLHANEMQVERIAQLGTGASNISKHPTLLRKQGLVVDRKEGPSIFYRGTIPHLMGFMWCVEKAVRQRLDSKMKVNAIPSR